MIIDPNWLSDPHLISSTQALLMTSAGENIAALLENNPVDLCVLYGQCFASSLWSRLTKHFFAICCQKL